MQTEPNSDTNGIGRWRWIPAFIIGLIIGGVGVILAMAAGWFDPPVVDKQPSNQWGQLTNFEPKVQILKDGREFKLLETLIYTDPQNSEWIAPEGIIVDGASIPKVFWNVPGGPLSGKYRVASIIHDHACRERTESSDRVHVMFYNACRCCGVPEKKAKMMFTAVYLWGPQWTVASEMFQKVVVSPDGKKSVQTVRRKIGKLTHPTQEVSDDAKKRLERLFEKKNPSLDELKKLAPSEF